MPKVIVTCDRLPYILSRIETWTGELTWGLLCKDVEAMFQVDSVTRQTLSSYVEIQKAFTKRKAILRSSSPSTPEHANSSDIEYLNSQLQHLELELERANALIERYRHRFVLWQYNAYQNGLRIESMDDAVDMLEKPLVEIKRRDGGA